MPKFMDYLELVESILLVINEVIAIALFGKTIWKIYMASRKNTFYFCPNLKNFIFVTFMSSIAALLYGFYMAVFWRPEPIYDPRIVFYLGWYDNTWLPVMSVAVLIVTIERIIMLRFTYHYDQKWKTIVHSSGIGTCILVLVVNGAYYLWNLRYSDSSSVNVFLCMCQADKRIVFWTIKNIFGLLNVVFGAYFFYLLKTKEMESDINKKNHHLALIKILVIFFFDLLPSFVYFIASLWKVDLLNYTGGPSIRLLTSIEALYFAYKYDKVVRALTRPIQVSYLQMNGSGSHGSHKVHPEHHGYH